MYRGRGFSWSSASRGSVVSAPCRHCIESSGSRSSLPSRSGGSGDWEPRSRGTILLLLGRRLEAEGVLGGTLHYVYGYLPLLLFVFAHVVARAGDARAIGIDRPVRPWVPFAWASFISFGLTLRALMTGLGL